MANIHYSAQAVCELGSNELASMQMPPVVISIILFCGGSVCVGQNLEAIREL